MKHFLLLGTLTAPLFIPFIAFAAEARTIQDVLRNLGNIISVATPIVVAGALLGFFWGLALYLFGTSVDEKRKKGLAIMVWGIVALFVMLSIFGIVNAIQNGLGLRTGTIQTPIIQPMDSPGELNRAMDILGPIPSR
jgi:hypothetical protein